MLFDMCVSISSSFQSSPEAFCAEGRSSDLDALLHVVRSAKKFVHIAVMDYEAALVFGPHFTYVRLIKILNNIKSFISFVLWRE